MLARQRGPAWSEGEIVLICSAHGSLIDRDHRQCPREVVSGCVMAGRGGVPFSDFELDYLQAGESWRTRLLEDPSPLTHDERDAVAEFLRLGLEDFLYNGPHEDAPAAMPPPPAEQ